jgi:hypothetical protein
MLSDAPLVSSIDGFLSPMYGLQLSHRQVIDHAGNRTGLIGVATPEIVFTAYDPAGRMAKIITRPLISHLDCLFRNIDPNHHHALQMWANIEDCAARASRV